MTKYGLRAAAGVVALGMALLQAAFMLRVVFRSMHIASPIRMACRPPADVAQTAADCASGMLLVARLHEAMLLAALNMLVFAVAATALLIGALPPARRTG